jgi:phosphoribosylformylglycinamidine synthase
LITALGIIPDIKKVISVDLKKSGNLLYIVGKTYFELGGSEYYKIRGFIGRNVPIVRLEAKENMKVITAAIDAGYVKACHDISEGGLAVAISEMALSGRIGAEIYLRKVPREKIPREDYLLFSESNSRFLLEVPPKHKEEFEKLVNNIPHSLIGKVKGNSLSIYNLEDELIINIPLTMLRKAWKNTFGD